MEADKTQKLLKEKLKEKGLKVTHQRLLVLSVLEENSGSHMTAEDISYKSGDDDCALSPHSVNVRSHSAHIHPQN